MPDIGGFCQGGGIFYIIIYSIFILETDNFHVQGEQIAFYQLMVGLFCGEFFNGCLCKERDAGRSTVRYQIFMNIIMYHIKTEIRRQDIPEKLTLVKKQIGPSAFNGGRRIGSMRDISGYAGYISCRKRNAQSVIKFQGAVVRMADPDFKAIMKVQIFAADVRYCPVASGKQKNRKAGRKIIVPIFNNRFWFF